MPTDALLTLGMLKLTSLMVMSWPQDGGAKKGRRRRASVSGAPRTGVVDSLARPAAQCRNARTASAILGVAVDGAESIVDWGDASRLGRLGELGSGCREQPDESGRTRVGAGKETIDVGSHAGGRGGDQV